MYSLVHMKAFPYTNLPLFSSFQAIVFNDRLEKSQRRLPCSIFKPRGRKIRKPEWVGDFIFLLRTRTLYQTGCDITWELLSCVISSGDLETPWKCMMAHGAVMKGCFLHPAEIRTAPRSRGALSYGAFQMYCWHVFHFGSLLFYFN